MGEGPVEAALHSEQQPARHRIGQSWSVEADCLILPDLFFMYVVGVCSLCVFFWRAGVASA